MPDKRYLAPEEQTGAERQFLLERMKEGPPMDTEGEYPHPEIKERLTEKYSLHDTEGLIDLGPDPVEELDKELFDYIEHQWHRQYDIIGIPYFYPLGNFHYIVHGKLYHDLAANPEYARLRRIRQLGTVSLSPMFIGLDHSRADHSELFAMLMDLVMDTNGFGYRDRKTGIAAAYYHDIGIPFSSEHGKLFTKEIIEEGSMARRIMKESKLIRAALKRHRIDLDEVADAIEGKHKLLSPLINSREGLDLDNCSYLLTDTKLVGPNHPFAELNIIYSQQRPLEAWKNIIYKDDQWVFQDSSQLHTLLALRAYMYKMVYHNPWTRAREVYLARELRRLHGEGRFGAVDAFSLKDWEAENMLKGMMCPDMHHRIFCPTGSSLRERLDEREYDLSRLEEMEERYESEPNVLVAVQRGPRPATRTPTLSAKDGRVVMFEDAFNVPVHKGIEEIIDELTYIGVYYMTDEPEMGFRSEDTRDMRIIPTEKRREYLRKQGRKPPI